MDEWTDGWMDGQIDGYKESCAHINPVSTLSTQATFVSSLPPSQLRKDKASESQKCCKDVFCRVHINFSVDAARKQKVLLAF